ncbi:LamG-like jellyroll fold domain-containing protein [Nocardioides sp. SYSU D00065]|uniref:LamG-like jellyroll fold domain-containing protein n=1 Tax=Nocardioides sp. SYSU D00065 TaxID=2817378 RepID=UPI001B33DC20|nr:LamG-like jellyroll fold domain-containing protein [Nocardioides sp. SYSU D00065]
MKRHSNRRRSTLATLAALAVSGSLLAIVPGTAAPAAAAELPVADVLDVDFADGTADDTARDLSPTLFGDPEIVSDAARARTAYALDGDDAALYPMAGQYGAMASSFSVECSFRYDGTDLGGSEQDFCGAKEAGGFATYVSGGRGGFMAHIGGGYKNVRFPMEAGEWYHTLVVWNGSTLVLYVNGEQVAQTAAAGVFKAPSAGAQNFALGADAQPSNGVGFFAAATIDTARVYSSALTADDAGALAAAAVAEPVAPTADVLDVDFADGTPADRAQGLPVTEWNQPVVRPDVPLGRNVGEFDGSSAYLYPLGDDYPSLVDGFAVECTFKYDDDLPASGEERGNICGAKEAGGFSITLYGPNLSFNPNIAGTYRNLNVPVVADRWYHVVGTWDGQVASLYVDGVLARQAPAVGTLTAPPNATARNMVIGGDASTNNRASLLAPATVATARVFSEPLTRTDVLALRRDVLADGLATAPVTITGSTPAADSRITGPTTLSVETSTPQAVGRTAEYRLDGALVRPGDEIGPGLRAGEHTLTLRGSDVFGRPIDESVTFRSGNIPVGGGTRTGQAGGSVQLSSVATNPSGDDVTTTFVRAEAKVAADGFQGSVAELPTSLEFPHEQAADLAAPLQPGDGRLATSPSATGIAFQRHDVAVGAAEGQRISWSGTVDPTRSVTLRAWNGQAWEALDTARGLAEGAVALTGDVRPRHHHDGVVPIMVTGEDPFADDIPNEVRPAFEDPADYDFSLAHLTDTQYLSEGADEPPTQAERDTWRKTYTDITEWIVANTDERKIAFTAHTGDIMENWHNLGDDRAKAMREYEVASAAQRIIDDAGLVNTVLPGNHDNQYGQDNGPDALYNDYFGPERYAALSQAPRWTAARASYQPWKPGDNANNYVLFSAGGLDFVVVSLGFGVTAEESAWADGVLKQYADRNAIVLTHAYIAPSSNPDGRGGGMSYDGMSVRNTVVKENPNVFLVLSGHEHGVNIEVRKNLGRPGNHVVELLADYQFYKVRAGEVGLGNTGTLTPDTLLQMGSSFFRLLQFDVDRSEMSVDTYSPFLDNFGATEYDDRNRYNGTEDDFKMPIQLQHRATSFATDSLVVLDPTDEVIGSDTARSGWPASVTWDGLTIGETYAWQAVSRDAASGDELPGQVSQLALFTATADGVADVVAPVIRLAGADTVAHGAAFDPLAGVSVSDDRDGDLTGGVAVLGQVDTATAGRYQLVYLVSDAAGNQSVASRTVTVEPAPAPVNTARPAINGTPVVGQVVTADQGRWSNAANATFEVQWLRDGAPIQGATSGEYTVVAADSGAALSVRVTARAVGREPVAATSPTAVVGKVKPTATLKLKKVVRVSKRAAATITVTAPGAVPTGTVVVKVGRRTVDAVRLRADGTVKVRLPRLRVGTHRVKAVLLPSDGFARTKVTRTIRVRR